MTRGFSRGLGILSVIFLTFLFVVLPSLTGFDLGEKIFLGLLDVIYILLMWDIMNGKIWDYAHPKTDNQEDKS